MPKVREDLNEKNYEKNNNNHVPITVENWSHTWLTCRVFLFLLFISFIIIRVVYIYMY